MSSDKRPMSKRLTTKPRVASSAAANSLVICVNEIQTVLFLLGACYFTAAFAVHATRRKWPCPISASGKIISRDSFHLSFVFLFFFFFSVKIFIFPRALSFTLFCAVCVRALLMLFLMSLLARCCRCRHVILVRIASFDMCPTAAAHSAQYSQELR